MNLASSDITMTNSLEIDTKKKETKRKGKRATESGTLFATGQTDHELQCA